MARPNLSEFTIQDIRGCLFLSQADAAQKLKLSIRSVKRLFRKYRGELGLNRWPGPDNKSPLQKPLRNKSTAILPPAKRLPTKKRMRFSGTRNTRSSGPRKQKKKALLEKKLSSIIENCDQLSKVPLPAVFHPPPFSDAASVHPGFMVKEQHIQTYSTRQILSSYNLPLYDQHTQQHIQGHTPHTFLPQPAPVNPNYLPQLQHQKLNRIDPPPPRHNDHPS